MSKQTDQDGGHRKSQSQLPNKGACDRCRGQKLRCVWEPRSAQCQRCDRAKAICSISPPRPMGRPMAASSRNRIAQSDTSHEVHRFESPCPPEACVPTHDTSFSVDDVGTTQPDISWDASFSSLMNESCPSNAYNQPESFGVFSPPPVPAFFGAQINIDNPLGVQFSGQSAGNYHDEAGEIAEDTSNVIQLCNLTIALSRHPLHSAAMSANSLLCRKIVRLADLEIGRLLSMTAQLARIVPANDDSSPRQAQSTILLILSCYSRLEAMFFSAIDALKELQKSEKPLDDSNPLMTGLVVDGFSLGTSQELQMRFIIQICEQTRETILQVTGEFAEPDSITLHDIGVAIAKLLSS